MGPTEYPTLIFINGNATYDGESSVAASISNAGDIQVCQSPMPDRPQLMVMPVFSWSWTSRMPAFWHMCACRIANTRGYFPHCMSYHTVCKTLHDANQCMILRLTAHVQFSLQTGGRR